TSPITCCGKNEDGKREWKRCWPFLTGFAVTGVLITKLTAEEDAKNSKFVQQHRR
ncbi:unnamed protein product, partial [Arabidopsis halleri]